MAVNPIEDYVLFTYTSGFGQHTMIRPTRTWTGVPWDTAMGSFTNWNDEDTPAYAMINSFKNLMLPLFKPDTTFNNFVIYHLFPGDDVAIPVNAFTWTSGNVGTSDDETQSRAWQRTYTFRSTGSYLAKICLMDTPCGGLVSRYNSVPALSPDEALINGFMSVENAWMSRADQRPVWFKTLTTQTNKGLEKKYGLN